MAVYKVPVIPGDGIGPEVIREGRKVLDAVGEADGFSIDWVELPFGADHYLKTKELISDSAIDELRSYKGIFLGAVGDPRVEPGVLEVGILLKLRFMLDEYVNLRPVYLYDGVSTPLAGKRPSDVRFVVVRENTEDFYIGLGGRLKRGRQIHLLNLVRGIYSAKFKVDVEADSEELAYQIGAITREGAERIITYAFEYAKKKGRRKVTCVDKANVLTYMYGLWRDVFREVAKGYPEIGNEFVFVDAASMYFVKNPEWFDVAVTPNMFGDILTDLGATIQGGIGVAPGGNINPKGASMFEPIHGSAPTLKGKNVANPVATILAGGMLLEALGLDSSAKKLEQAVADVLREGIVKTPDLGGSSTTSEVGDSVASKVKSL